VAQTGGCGKDHDKEKSLTRQVKNLKSPTHMLNEKEVTVFKKALWGKLYS
jgi:hypothetical protein